MSRPRVFLPACFVAVLLCAHAANVSAQSIWMPQPDAPFVRLEWYKANYDLANDITFLTSVWFLTGAIKVAPTIAVVAEVPFSYYNEEPSSGTFEAESAFGNPYVAVLVGSTGTVGVGEFGIRLPMVTDDNFSALVNGWMTDFSRWEAFLPDILTVRARGGANLPAASGAISIRLLVGANLLVPTEGGGDSELMADADAGIWYRPVNFTVGAVLSGKTLLSESDLSLKERSEAQLSLAALAQFGSFEPGVSLRLPLFNDGLAGLGDLVSAVYGLNLTVHLGPEDK